MPVLIRLLAILICCSSARIASAHQRDLRPTLVAQIDDQGLKAFWRIELPSRSSRWLSAWSAAGSPFAKLGDGALAEPMFRRLRRSVQLTCDGSVVPTGTVQSRLQRRGSGLSVQAVEENVAPMSLFTVSLLGSASPLAVRVVGDGARRIGPCWRAGLLVPPDVLLQPNEALECAIYSGDRLR